MVQAQIISAADLRNGVQIAYRKADAILTGRTHDDNGLNREEIAAINLYTMDTPFYPACNGALATRDRSKAKPFF